MSLVLLLVGCVPTFKLDKAPTCNDGDYLAFTGGLTFHILQGPGDGTFDYDPEGDQVEQIDGFYDLKTGDLWWDANHDDESYIEREKIRGGGIAWTDGDLDFEAEVEVEYRDGSEVTYDLRERRLGCDWERRMEFGDDDVRFESIELDDDDSYDYTREWHSDGRNFEATGSMEEDGDYSETVDYDGDGVTILRTNAGDADGDFRSDFKETTPSETREGFVERQLDGDERWVFTVTRGSVTEEWDYSVDFEGNGEGAIDFGDDECDVKFEGGECTLDDCTDGRSGPC